MSSSVYRTRQFLAALVALTAALHSSAQFVYSDFSSDSGLVLSGSATRFGSVIRLTDSGEDQAGSLFVSAQQNIAAAFVTSMQFTMSGGDGNGYDGMALVFHRSGGAAVVGNAGSDLGLGGALSTYLAVTLTTGGFDRVEIRSSGSGTLAQAAGSFGVLAGSTHTFLVSYDGTRYLTATLDGNQQLTYDLGGTLGAILGGDSAWVGVTAATGGGVSDQAVTALSFGSAVPEPSTYAAFAGLVALAGVALQRRRFVR